MKIAVIGAGPSGLVSAKYAIEHGHQCDVFEEKGTHGGIWVYTEQTGVDENGVEIHSPIYEGLITNLPKEVMAFVDFPYPEQSQSYLSQPEILDYFNRYADHFNLVPHIKYYKSVTKVKPLPDDKWFLSVQDVRSKIKESNTYDAIFICNGHYSIPRFPQIPGEEKFEGPQWHSEMYRNPEPFKNKIVLIIGWGFSALEIVKFISEVTRKIYLSRRKESVAIKIPECVIDKPVVRKLTKTGAVFEDGTTEEFDIILYCTGFKYSFPFLTEDCGIKVDDNCVYPLYKHVINVEHPTMYFIGIPFLACLMPMFDLQVRFALAALEEKFTMPSKERMLKELEEYMHVLKEKKIPIRKTHQIGRTEHQASYFRDLAETAGIKNVPPVVTKIYEKVIALFGSERNYNFKIIDDDNFIISWDKLL